MYEEEDDDLPMQYRRLTAHLQTTNADFDRRLAAYLTNHVAMRTALGQAVSDSYAHNQYPPGAQQFMNPAAMPMPMQGAFANPMLPPQMMNRSPTNYRQSPYPMPSPMPPNAQTYKPSPHARSMSIATPQELSSHQQHSNQTSPVDNVRMEDRRMSMPAQGMLPQTPQSQASAQPVASPTHRSPVVSRNTSNTNLANLKNEATQHSFFKPGSTSPPVKQDPQQQPTPPQQQPMHVRHQSFPSPFTMASGFNPEMQNMNYNPFTTALPMESQQLLGPAFEGNDAFSSMFMPGNDSRMQQPFYSYNPNGNSRKPQAYGQAFDGMNQTLAPSMLDTSVGGHGSYSTPQSANADSATTPYGFGMGFEHGFGAPSSASASGQVTPVEGNWQSLIEGDLFNDPQTVT